MIDFRGDILVKVRCSDFPRELHRTLEDTQLRSFVCLKSFKVLIRGNNIIRTKTLFRLATTNQSYQNHSCQIN